ncbi:MAG: sugar transferase [Butyrivibrio sp.]|nr:sugar transferase [Butyrivibrio sp.]MBP3238164.1 sugar transferase [Lachnospiraceae bacterium]
MKPSGSLIYRFTKRSFDVVASTVLMIPIGLVIGVSGIFIKAEDKGPVFYMADRTGRFGKTFKMFKLRSMKVNAPDIRLSDGSTYNGDDDPRVTKFGKFARKTSIDGNVIIGQTTESLVNKGFREVSPFHFLKGRDLFSQSNNSFHLGGVDMLVA